MRQSSEQVGDCFEFLLRPYEKLARTLRELCKNFARRLEKIGESGEKVEGKKS